MRDLDQLVEEGNITENQAKTITFLRYTLSAALVAATGYVVFKCVSNSKRIAALEAASRTAASSTPIENEIVEL